MVMLDVDGVLSDGRIIYDSKGMEYKCFDAHDGFGIKRAIDHGILFAIISGRVSDIVPFRSGTLRIREVHQGATDKLAVFDTLRQKYKLTAEQCCFIGDDEFDLPLLRKVGFSASPADAMPTVRKFVDYIATARGGRGAVREVLDLILRAQRTISKP